MEITYKTLYLDLSYYLCARGISVNDYDYLGYCYQVEEGTTGFIVIKPHLSFKEKYLTLCHEMGHLFKFNKNGKFVRMKKTRNEEQANRFAVELLRLNNIDLTEYAIFYSKAAKRKLKKAWTDLIED